MSVIEKVVDYQVEEWKDGDVQIQHLSGGLTNTNYKVTVDGMPFFIRVPGEGTELLAIDRNNEYHNSKAAANAGVAPEINHFPEHSVMVLKFLEGKTMSKDSLNERDADAHGAVHQATALWRTLLNGLQHVPPHRVLSPPVQ
jgi:thiamine kinase-like enzyme